jgi:hypothetical protein
MEETWYFSRDGQRMGPFSFEQLKQMASSGVLNMGDMMLRLGEQQWVPAKNVEGLFAAGSEIEIATIPAKPQADRSSLPERMPPAPPPIPATASATRHPEGSAESSAATANFAARSWLGPRRRDPLVRVRLAGVAFDPGHV